MLISKFTSKDGKTKVAMTIHVDTLKSTKNAQYKRLVLDADYLVGLDDKKQAKVSEIINLDKLVDNTSKK